MLSLMMLSLLACDPASSDKDDDDGHLMGTDTQPTGGGSTPPTDAPDIELSVTEIDFGEIDPSDGLPSETVLISNLGGVELNLSAVYLVYGDQGFSLGDLQTDVVPSGADVALTIDFSPKAADAVTDTVVIASDDPDEPTLEIALSGSRVAAWLDASPDPADFGEVGVGCREDLDVTLTNETSELLRILELEIAGDEVLSIDDALLPWTLGPEESHVVSASFRPEEIGAAAATVTLLTDSVDVPERDLELSGAGISGGAQTDTFDVDSTTGAFGIWGQSERRDAVV